jgi:hypothetical protein
MFGRAGDYMKCVRDARYSRGNMAHALPAKLWVDFLPFSKHFLAFQ